MIDTLRTRLAALAAAGGLAAGAAAQPPADQLPAQPLPPQVQPAPAPPANPLPVDPGVEKAAPLPGGPVAGEPKVVRWHGGYVMMNGHEVVVRHAGAGGRSTNVVSGSGNGFGNTVVVDGGAGGVTVVRNARNGVGNRLVVNPEDLLLDLDDDLFGELGAHVPGRAGVFGGVGAAAYGPVLVTKPAPVDPVVVPKPVPADPAAPPAAPAPAPKVYKGKNHPFWDRKAWSDAHDCNLYWSPADKLWFRYVSDDDTYRPVPNGPAAPEAPVR